MYKHTDLLTWYTIDRLISNVIILRPGEGEQRVMLSVTKLRKDMGNRTLSCGLFLRFNVYCIQWYVVISTKL